MARSCVDQNDYGTASEARISFDPLGDVAVIPLLPARAAPSRRRRAPRWVSMASRASWGDRDATTFRLVAQEGVDPVR